MRRLIITLSLLCNVIAVPVMSVPSQIMIIRPSEKNPDGNLSERGLERAGALAPLIALTDYLIIYGPLIAIFASRPTLNTPPYAPDENTERCMQTVGPTAEFLKLPIHSGFAKFQEAKIANFILNNSLYNNKNILICWHHSRIQDLAMALGVGLAPPFPDVYDQVWVITYLPGPSLTIYQQELLFGDTP